MNTIGVALPEGASSPLSSPFICRPFDRLFDHVSQVATAARP